MAEQDHLEYQTGAGSDAAFMESGDDFDSPFEDHPHTFDDVLDDYSNDSANQDILEDRILDQDFERAYSNDDADADAFDDDEFEYISTPPEAFIRSCKRQLQYGPQIDMQHEHGQGSLGKAPAGSPRVGISERGPSYSL